MTDPYEGALAHRNLPDGRVLVVYNMIYNVRLCIGPQNAEWYDRAWCYEKPDHIADAMVALETWDGKDTPPGTWIKEVGT